MCLLMVVLVVISYANAMSVSQLDFAWGAYPEREHFPEPQVLRTKLKKVSVRALVYADDAGGRW